MFVPIERLDPFPNKACSDQCTYFNVLSKCALRDDVQGEGGDVREDVKRVVIHVLQAVKVTRVNRRYVPNTTATLTNDQCRSACSGRRCQCTFLEFESERHLSTVVSCASRPVHS